MLMINATISEKPDLHIRMLFAYDIRVTPREVCMKHGPTNTTILKNYKSSLKLSEDQKKILFGTVLGDGCLISSRSGKAARLQIRQKAKYEEFVNFKYQFFKDWVLTKPRYDRFNDSLVFRTICHPDLMEVRKIFYGDRGKFVPDAIKE